jgi:hypothetical protein
MFLPEMFLILDGNGNLTEIQFIIEGATVSVKDLTGSTTLDGSQITITQEFGTSSIQFVGTLDGTNTVATGDLSVVLDLDSVQVNLPNTPAILWKQ